MEVIWTGGDGGLNRLVAVTVGEGVRLECFERIWGKKMREGKSKGFWVSDGGSH